LAVKRLLLDVDVLLKLARLGLLQPLAAACKEWGVELQWLGSAFYTLGLNNPSSKKTIRRCGRSEAVTALVDFCNKHPPIELAESELDDRAKDQLAILASSWTINEGEALLLVKASLTEAYVATDDVRAVAALSTEPGLEGLQKRLGGKWVTLLHLVAALIDRMGFEVIKRLVVKDLSSDRAIQAIFGSGLEATESAVTEALAYYLADRRKSNAELFCLMETITAERQRKGT